MSKFLETTCTKTLQAFIQILSQLRCSRYGKTISFYLSTRKNVLTYE